MSIMMIGQTENAVHAERWQKWQVAYTESSRQSATRVRTVFTVVLTAVAIAFGVQLLST